MFSDQYWQAIDSTLRPKLRDLYQDLSVREERLEKADKSFDPRFLSVKQEKQLYNAAKRTWPKRRDSRDVPNPRAPPRQVFIL